jgi:hypothetical protein
LAWIPGPCDDLAITQNSARTSGKQSDLHLKVDPIAGIPPVDSTVSGILAYFQEGQPPRGVAVTLDRRTMNLPVPK